VSPLDAHPEELIDRALCNDASPTVMRDLHAHARRCDACVAHVKIGRQLAAELAPRAEDRMRDERAIGLTMRKMVQRRQRRHLGRMLVLAAAIVCVAGAAVAQLWTVGRSYALRVSEPPTQGVLSAPRVSAASMVDHVRAPLVVNVPREARSAKNLVVEDGLSAVALFAQANELRRAGHDDQAMALYRRLQHLFPGSPQAEQSNATLGQLLLQRSSSDEALSQFDRYLSHAGPLTEDVLVGRALSLERLGRAHDERRTWEALLQHYPTSIHAARAKARLAELNGLARDEK
jgi:TolA-binding protein